MRSIKYQYTKGYKESVYGWIPENWDIKKMGNLIKLISGLHLNREEYNINGQGIPYFTGPTDYTNSINKVSKTTRKKSASAKANDILITVKGSGVGSMHFLQLEEVAIGRQIMAIRADDIYTSMFIYQSLLQKQYHFQELAKGNMIPGLSRSDILTIDIVTPTIEERKKIVSILTTWDKAITQTQQLITQLQQRNKGLMQELLKPKAEWKEKKLSDFFERITRKNTTGNLNVVTISAQRGFIKQNDFFNKTVASEKLDTYFLVHKGEFCYNKSYSNGYDWGATKRLNDFDEAVVTTLYICFRIKDDKKSSGEFFEFYFDACLLDQELSKVAHEGGRAHGLLNVTPKDFFNLKIQVPDYDEQIRIFNILSAAKAESMFYKKQLAALQQQKKGLMQKLLTGEIRVNKENHTL